MTPLLALPISFGSAYIGEAFSCTLCANHEDNEPSAQSVITDVKIEAELSAPGDAGSHVTPLKVEQPANSTRSNGDTATLGPDQSIQVLVKHTLFTAGTHTLAVTVTYNEAASELQKTQRTFRKVYQFLAQRGLDVKTKVTDVSSAEPGNGRFIVEAKIENLTDQVVLLDSVILEPGKHLGNVTPVNDIESSMLAPGDVMQSAFVVVQEKQDELIPEEHGRVTVGRLGVAWRIANGQARIHQTGWLTARRAKV